MTDPDGMRVRRLVAGLVRRLIRRPSRLRLAGWRLPGCAVRSTWIGMASMGRNLRCNPCGELFHPDVRRALRSASSVT